MLQYRNRVSPHAAGCFVRYDNATIELQYRNRVSPHAAGVWLVTDKGEECFNTAIGYSPMRPELYTFRSSTTHSFNTATGLPLCGRNTISLPEVSLVCFNTAAGFPPLRPPAPAVPAPAIPVSIPQKDYPLCSARRGCHLCRIWPVVSIPQQGITPCGCLCRGR